MSARKLNAYVKLSAGLLVASVCGCLRGTLLADLAWEQQSLKFNPGVAETEIVGHFKFRNAGDTAIEIISTQTSCGCTTASVSKRSYAPGETGEVEAKFSIEDRVGTQKQEIFVTTNEPGKPPVQLTLESMIPPLAVVEPDILRWLPGDVLTPKRIRVIPAPGVKMTLTGVTSSDPDVSARIEAGARPEEFEVVVTPHSDKRTLSGILHLETDFPKAHPKALIAHVQIAH